jgi:hypothetical protein
MTIITIPPEIEVPLAEAAKQRGTTPELLALEGLRNMYAPATHTSAAENGNSLADFLQGYIGRISGTSEPLSEDTGRRFTEILHEQRP